MSCLVSVTADDNEPFVLVAKFEIETNSFKFANINLTPKEILQAWSPIPRAFYPNRVF